MKLATRTFSIVALFIFIVIKHSSAQKLDYNWCFGDSCGIHFTDSSATFFVSALSYDPLDSMALESCASISDTSGNLLFYTSGSIVWNKNHQVMPNGTGLLEENTVTQGALILRKPDDSLLYYVFHVRLSNPTGFYYSIVNMSLDNNLGDIDTAHKNILLDEAGQNEKVSAVRHANGRDWWIVHREGSTSNYYIYLLTPDTITLVNIQSIGYATNNLLDYGEMNFSPAGDKLISITGKGKRNLMDFDRCSGELSNLVDLTQFENTSFYGSSFSPDGSKLYLSSTNNLFQYDLNALDILQSKQLIWNDPYGNDENELAGYNIFHHQLAPDGKIYLAISQLWPMDTFPRQNLCVINKPNSLGTDCDVQPFSFYLEGHQVTFGLPNSPNYNLGALIGSECDTIFNSIIPVCCTMEEATIFPIPTSTTITLSLPSNQNAMLSIFNLLGEKVKEEKVTGKEVTMDVSSLPQGVYLVRMENGVVGKFVKE